MTDSDQLKMFLALALGHLPVMLVSIVALALVAEQRQRAPGAARWAFMGFGLLLALSIVMPLGQVLIQAWIVRASLSIKQYQWIYGVFGTGGSGAERCGAELLVGRGVRWSPSHRRATAFSAGLAALDSKHLPVCKVPV